MCDCVVLVLLFLMFKGDGNTIHEFKVGMCVKDDLSVLEEANIPHVKLFYLALFCLQDFKIFERSTIRHHSAGLSTKKKTKVGFGINFYNN
jgi:hypothetical protein